MENIPAELKAFLLDLGKKYSFIPPDVQTFDYAFLVCPDFYPRVIQTREAKELERIVDSLGRLEDL